MSRTVQLRQKTHNYFEHQVKSLKTKDRKKNKVDHIIALLKSLQRFSHLRGNRKVFKSRKNPMQSDNPLPMTPLTLFPITLPPAHSAPVTLSSSLFLSGTLLSQHICHSPSLAHSSSRYSCGSSSSLSVRPSWAILFKTALPSSSTFYSFFSTLFLTMAPNIHDTLCLLSFQHQTQMWDCHLSDYCISSAWNSGWHMQALNVCGINACSVRV